MMNRQHVEKSFIEAAIKEYYRRLFKKTMCIQVTELTAPDSDTWKHLHQSILLEVHKSRHITAYAQIPILK
jgi:hypothetical protein